ncbi:MAG: dynamin [Pseudonocardiaceae bacterium]|nr:dynamin [Pseudonocardiaceae bacterium]
MSAPQTSSTVQYAAETLDLAIKGSRVYEREDLVQRLTGARRLIAEPAVTVYVVGEFKQGKSSLINALLTAPICPVDDDIATAVPTEIRFAAQPNATATYQPDESAGRSWIEQIPISELGAYVSEAGNPGNARRLRSVTVGLDRQLLAGGLVLVDTPGVGGLGSVHNTVTVGALPEAHAVIFVSDASQELTAEEVKFLRTAGELCPRIIFAMSKIDLYPQWRRILELNLGHLRRSGASVEPLAISSTLRVHAAQAQDEQLNDESGFPALLSALQRVLHDAERLALQSLANHVLSAVSQLEGTVRSKKAALEHPERVAELTAALETANERAERLKAQSARWQQILVDGFADISSDVDFDLRSRVRVVLAEAEKTIDDGDPGKNWDEFEQWLRQRIASEAMDNYALLVRSAREVGARVAEHFEIAEAAITTPTDGAAASEFVQSIEVDSSFAGERKRMAGGMAGFQKGYMGVLMITMMGTLTSLVIPLPIGLAAGALMGRAGFKDERKRQLEKCRSQAKMSVRRFIDEFNLKAGKDSRDGLRRLQRDMRDGYTQRAEELQRSVNEALKGAQEAVRKVESDTKEAQRLQTDLDSLRMVRSRATQLSESPARQQPEPRAGVIAGGGGGGAG